MSKNENALVEVRVLEGKEENVGEIKMAFRRYLSEGRVQWRLWALHNSNNFAWR